MRLSQTVDWERNISRLSLTLEKFLPNESKDIELTSRRRSYEQKYISKEDQIGLSYGNLQNENFPVQAARTANLLISYHQHSEKCHSTLHDEIQHCPVHFLFQHQWLW